MSNETSDPRVIISVAEIREIRDDMKSLRVDMTAFMLQQAPMLARLEERVTSVEKRVDGIEEDLDTDRSHQTSGRWSLASAALGGTAGAVLGVIPQLLSHWH